MKNPLFPQNPQMPQPPQTPRAARSSAFDAQAIQATIDRALQSAGLSGAAGRVQGMAPGHSVLQTFRRGLAPARQAEAGVATRTFSNEAGSRGYKLHVPAGPLAAAPALIVMLHGCTQSADDFAAGTRMNRLADQHGFLVAYPEQGTDANASKCWNWFKPQDQRRVGGEPSLIAGIALQVAQTHNVDRRRVFVAGLSAGAAMAVVLGETYPELFAAVGAHSGLPYGCAQDMASALSAMKGGRGSLPGSAVASPAGASAARAPRRAAAQAVPVIVFHGDRDHTVQQSNGALIVQQARQAHAAAGGPGGGAELRVMTRSGIAPGGRRYTCSVELDGQGQPRIESWTLHGAGHAWSGGDAAGTYIDTTGPDASAEMVRFFMAQSPPDAVG